MRYVRHTTRRTAATSRARRFRTPVPAVVLLAALTAVGCAGKGYVRHEVEPLDDRLAAVASEPEATADALTAQDARLDETAKLAALALERADEAALRLRQAPPLEPAYTVDGVRFAPGGARLTAEAEALLDQLATRLELEDRAARLEIRSSADALGRARGTAVRRHLHVAGGVPLHTMRIVPFASAVAGGDATPAMDGRTAIDVLRPPSLP